MRYSDVLKELHELADPRAAKKVERFGVSSQNAIGISAPVLRALARKIGTNQAISLKLWSTGFLEARALAALVGDPRLVTRRQMGEWARDFDSWAVCDACCGELFVWTPYALDKAFAWSSQKREYVKRAGFVLMAAAAIHLKTLSDDQFLPMLEAIERGSGDGRNFVRKSVNWALRQIGKRNSRLNKLAVQTARKLIRTDASPARWIGSDALKELTSDPVQRRLRVRARRLRTK